MLCAGTCAPFRQDFLSRRAAIQVGIAKKGTVTVSATAADTVANSVTATIAAPEPAPQPQRRTCNGKGPHSPTRTCN